MLTAVGLYETIIMSPEKVVEDGGGLIEEIVNSTTWKRCRTRVENVKNDKLQLRRGRFETKVETDELFRFYFTTSHTS